MTNYISLDQFASTLGTTNIANINAEFAEECIATASLDINNYCSRRFYPETAPSPAATETRDFLALNIGQVFIDDAYEVTSVAVDTAADGTYSTTWAAAAFVAVRALIDGVPYTDRPYTSIISTTGYTFPVTTRPVNVRVTGRWGWATPPSPVKSACRRLAQLAYEARNAPFGAAGTPETGYIRLREDKLACQWLDPFVRQASKFLVA